MTGSAKKMKLGALSDRLAVLVFGVVVGAACSTLSTAAPEFPFPYFGLSLGTDIASSRLLNKNPKQDAALELCRPQPGEPKGKCYVLFRDAKNALQVSYFNLERRAIECEAREAERAEPGVKGPGEPGLFPVQAPLQAHN